MAERSSHLLTLQLERVGLAERINRLGSRARSAKQDGLPELHDFYRDCVNDTRTQLRQADRLIERLEARS